MNARATASVRHTTGGSGHRDPASRRVTGRRLAGAVPGRRPGHGTGWSARPDHRPVMRYGENPSAASGAVIKKPPLVCSGERLPHSQPLTATHNEGFSQLR